jgi:DTW domain-containing protein YfiP
MPARPAQRLGCPHCLRPQNACICRWVCRIEHQVEVLVLQHPLEVHHPKGSARLLHLCLPHSRLLSGEVFAPAALDDSLHAPWDQAPAPQLTLLLYPNTASDPALPVPPELPPAALIAPARIRLVVLDGTWRKSRRMLYANPLLQQLPRLALHDMPPSNYQLRRAHRADQLSTLEATCAALMQLERQTAPFTPLLRAFDGFVTQQLAWQGALISPSAAV